MTLPAFGPALALLVAAPAPAGQVAPPPSPAIAPTPALAVPPVTPGEANISAAIAEPATRPRPRHAPGDPFERINRYFYRQHMKFDHALLRPVSLGYKHVVPGPVRRGLRHFFTNLKEPLIALNYLLQLKPGKAAETLARFAVNSTLGLGGFLDVANEPGIHLPHRPNGFGDTLGYYGVKPGPYIFLPFFGPTTLRDLIGGAGEGLALPKLSISPFDTPEYQVTHNVTSGLDRRAEADEDLNALLKDAVDPYATFRSAFLQDRAGEIAALHGRSAVDTSAPELSDPLTDPGGGATSTPPSNAPELDDPSAMPAAPSSDANGTSASASDIPDPSPAKAGAR